jgi:peptidoglycan/xylan/chitin deacetylase (PgdA/CDA1 family)
VKEGHDFGGHTWTHPHLHKLGTEQARVTLSLSLSLPSALCRRMHSSVNRKWAVCVQVAYELDRTAQQLRSITGRPQCFVRPPHGASSETVERLAAHRNVSTVYWTSEGEDWDPIGADRVYSNLMSQLTTFPPRRKYHPRRPGCDAQCPPPILLFHDASADPWYGFPYRDRRQTAEALERVLATLTGRGVSIVRVDGSPCSKPRFGAAGPLVNYVQK